MKRIKTAMVTNGELKNKVLQGVVNYEPQGNQFFPITFITREDLESYGFDTTNLDKETMKQLAHNMENDFLDNSFFEMMERNALEMEIKKKNPTKND
ncbi:hypothetical protein BFS16_08000 [Hoylesella timonensis]|uniref:Uncharacterized protein n=2 Tax=Prevotellaceae TaxID=171552 RepID=A0A2U0TKI2_9BACT|nr:MULTISPECIES: hypothetical protein [Prevotellaceae]PNP94107.1 hypothetical protein BFS16_08000 [Hoylesella timonensis]PVX44048.1 hypothetical protein C7379_13224 [Hallella colorans]